MYVDSAYLAKFYLNEPDADRVREIIRRAESVVSSAWAIGEVTWAFHRHFRNGLLKPAEYRELLDAFMKHVDGGAWIIAPLTDSLLRRMTVIARSLPRTIFLRTGDAVHLITAMDLGETEIWSNDRHLLAAAEHFGLAGRSV